MSFSYDNALSLVALIDSKCSYLLKEYSQEVSDKTQLSAKISGVKASISDLEKAIENLSSNFLYNATADSVKKYIDNWWNRCESANSIQSFIAEATHLSTIVSMTRLCSDALKQEQVLSNQQIERVKNHRNYKMWVKNADKVGYAIIDNAMPDSLSAYSDRALDTIISYGGKIIWRPYKRYMFFYVYSLYKKEIQTFSERKKLIEFLDAINRKSVLMVPEWTNALQKELQIQRLNLDSLNQAYSVFDKNANVRLSKVSTRLGNEITTQFPPNAVNGFLKTKNNENVVWNEIHRKSDVTNNEREDFILSYYHGLGKTDISHNQYILSFVKKVVTLYPEFLSIDKKHVTFKYPMIMHLDTLRFRLAFNIESSQRTGRSPINGFVQTMVASIISNMPVGKAKFIFSDPSNTGVFSNFRDVGKNESEGSRLCSYIVSVDSINRELERLSNEVSYTINNILKGTRTTLYQHNKERAFNSSPYVFLFLMDYPQNMIAHSLQCLQNIVENGPKCGIFTVIFNTRGTALQLLKADEQHVAEEIAKNNFLYQDGRMYDAARNGNWLNTANEIETASFDLFVQYYNEAIKESQQLTVSLDELEGVVCDNGEYKIPIGKNLGGETEYMSFFGSCQDYLMSGATRIGKTNALHVIIYNTLKYVPNAELYLVDFKQGVEFAPYASLNHPVIKALAVESVPEFGYVVLKHIEDKIRAISELFIGYSVKNWKEYYEKTGKVIPVTIVILDEFQHLFDTDVGKDCGRIIEVIAKEGGAFNVHIILSTQSVSNVSGLTEAAKENIFGRMVFYHSEREYASMLWNDSHLALTLNDEVKGQMVFATGDKNSQRLLQWALAKPVNNVVNELSYPVENGRFQTKLLLSTIRENPFSVFNAIISRKYSAKKDDSYDITIGNEVNVFSGELRKLLENGNGILSTQYTERSCIQLADRPNENILLVGNNEEIAEGCFQLALYSALVRQVLFAQKMSIVLLAPDLATRLTDIVSAFSDYIDYYNQESDLSTIDLDDKKFFFVFGLQNFRSLSYQPDMRTAPIRNENFGMPASIIPQTNAYGFVSDGTLFQKCVEDASIHVIVWHSNMEHLSNMFGGVAKIQDFMHSFLHKVGFHMNDKNDSRLFLNSDVCNQLSNNAAVYVKMNKERIIRPYKAMDSGYCSDLNDALRNEEGSLN